MRERPKRVVLVARVDDDLDTRVVLRDERQYDGLTADVVSPRARDAADAGRVDSFDRDQLGVKEQRALLPHENVAHPAAVTTPPLPREAVDALGAADSGLEGTGLRPHQPPPEESRKRDCRGGSRKRPQRGAHAQS